MKSSLLLRHRCKRRWPHWHQRRQHIENAAIWAAIQRLRDNPLADLGEFLHDRNEEHDPVPTLVTTAAILIGVASYVTARDSGAGKRRAQRWGRERRYHALLATGHAPPGVPRRDLERELFGLDASTFSTCPHATLRGYLEQLLSSEQRLRADIEDVCCEVDLDYAEVYRLYADECWGCVNSSVEDDWGWIFDEGEKAYCHWDFARRIVLRAADWIAMEYWRSDEDDDEDDDPLADDEV